MKVEQILKLNKYLILGNVFAEQFFIPSDTVGWTSIHYTENESSIPGCIFFQFVVYTYFKQLKF